MNTDINKYIYHIYLHAAVYHLYTLHTWRQWVGPVFFPPGLPGDSLGQSAKLLVAMAMAMAWYRNDQWTHDNAEVVGLFGDGT